MPVIFIAKDYASDIYKQKIMPVIFIAKDYASDIYCKR